MQSEYLSAHSSFGVGFFGVDNIPTAAMMPIPTSINVVTPTSSTTMAKTHTRGFCDSDSEYDDRDGRALSIPFGGARDASGTIPREYLNNRGIMFAPATVYQLGE